MVGLQLAAIGPRDLPAWWPRLLPLVQKWIARGDGEWAIPEVYDAITARDLQCWVALKEGEPTALALTELWNSRKRKYCQVVALAAKGDDELDAWLTFHVDIEAWAKQNGCDRVRGDGRLGWERALKPFGYKRLYSVVIKEIR